MNSTTEAVPWAAAPAPAAAVAGAGEFTTAMSVVAATAAAAEGGGAVACKPAPPALAFDDDTLAARLSMAAISTPPSGAGRGGAGTRESLFPRTASLNGQLLAVACALNEMRDYEHPHRSISPPEIAHWCGSPLMSVSSRSPFARGGANGNGKSPLPPPRPRMLLLLPRGPGRLAAAHEAPRRLHDVVRARRGG